MKNSTVNYGKTALEIKNMCKENSVAIIDGTKYGNYGNNFIRVNIGTSKEILKKGLERIKNSIKI